MQIESLPFVLGSLQAVLQLQLTRKENKEELWLKKTSTFSNLVSWFRLG